MSRPIRCPHCGTISSGGLILPIATIASDPVDTTAARIPAPGPAGPLRCPLCRRDLPMDAIDESNDIRRLVDEHLTPADLHDLRELLRRTLHEPTPNPAVERKLSNLTGNLRLAPRGYAEWVAFLALVVATATLVENTVADFGTPVGLANLWPKRSADKPDPTPPPTSRGHLQLREPIDRSRFDLNRRVLRIRGRYPESGDLFWRADGYPSGGGPIWTRLDERGRETSDTSIPAEFDFRVRLATAEYMELFHPRVVICLSDPPFSHGISLAYLWLSNNNRTIRVHIR